MRTEHRSETREKLLSLSGIQVSDRATEERDQPRFVALERAELLQEVARDRLDDHAGVSSRNRPRARLQRLLADVHGNEALERADGCKGIQE